LRLQLSRIAKHVGARPFLRLQLSKND